MGRKELIKDYIEFFKRKGHAKIPGASLVPLNDPTVLFTTAGMHPLVPFLAGQPHPLGKRLCNVQRCIRTGDIEEVGDGTHHTFFEMLGNWSLGDYFKKEAIEYSFEFLTKILKIPRTKLAVTCFAGDKNAEKDEEAEKVWLSVGMKKERIAFLPKENNWWGPAGESGPCGPDTEMFFWRKKSAAPAKFNPENPDWVEIWNDVFMQYNKTKEEWYDLLAQKNVDTGMGVERTVAALNGLTDNYMTQCFLPIIHAIEKKSGKKYKGNERAMRIIADHVKAAVMIIADGVKPSNTERGYVLRRLIRRAIRYGRELGMQNFVLDAALPVFDIYDDYEHLQAAKKDVEVELLLEEEKFLKTLDNGLREFAKLSQSAKEISGKDAFLLFQSYGFPIEMTAELAKEKKIKVDMKGYELESKKHQELSRTASAGVFKSGLADSSDMTKRLHTATHLLNEALRQTVSKDIRQKGSNITPERLRFDFNLGRKVTDDELRAVEDWVNDKVEKELDIVREEMPVKKALESAQGEFGAKYPDIVSVYTIMDKDGRVVSKEICTGPHAGNTGELGRFKIVKEEGIAAGVRRIKATVSG